MASTGKGNTMTQFENPPVHFGIYHVNETLDWMPTDTKESYEKLSQDPDHRAYFAKMGWDQPGAITYRLNSHGFRADEFDGGPYMVALGCSYTMGIGLPDETTWARQTATALGMKCANLSWGGYSADSCFRLAEYWIPALKPDYVCMLVPPSHRVELLLDAQDPLLGNRQIMVEVFMPQSRSQLFNPNDYYLRHWFLNDENAMINQRKNVLAIRQLCADLNIPCTILNAEQHMWWSREEIGYARDCMHGGPKIHDILTKKFVDGYKK
jgi:hypothetical protein